MQRFQLKNVLLWLVAIGFFMETLDSTIVNTALPSMAKSLGESPLVMQSVIIAYSLTLGLCIPASGWIADRFGTRKVFFSAIILFSLGSLCCAGSHNLTQLVIARILQGIGGSMLMPVGRLAVLRAFPGDQFLDAIAFVTVPAMIGPLIGPTLGGWLVQYASWHWIFLINIPIGLLGCITTHIAMPDSRGVDLKPFDVIGFLQLAVSMVAISFGLDGLSELGFTHATVLVLFIFGFASLVSYAIRAHRKPNPLFPMSLFKFHTYTIGLLGNLFARIGSSGMPFLIPLLLQISLGYTPFQAGMTMIPIAVAAIFAKRMAGPLIRRFSYRSVLITNTFLVGFAIASFAFMSVEVPTWLRIAQLLFFGSVNSLQFTAMNTLTLKDLDPKIASSGNGLFSMVQMLAMSFGVATVAAVLSAFMNHFHGHENASFALQAFHSTFLCMGAITCTSAWIFWQLSPITKSTPPKTSNLVVG
jgi:EmrB/QacA subfamily drug resistance transporter